MADVVSYHWYNINLFDSPLNVHFMTAIQIGYARCSTDKQDLTVQQEALAKLSVSPDRIYLDKELTGLNRQRPGLDQALAAVRQGDTLIGPAGPFSSGCKRNCRCATGPRREAGTGNQHLRSG